MDIKNYKWQSDWAKSHIAQGYAQGMARALLRVLDARSVAVPDDVRTRITDCTDIEKLERWGRRAAVMDPAEVLIE